MRFYFCFSLNFFPKRNCSFRNCSSKCYDRYYPVLDNVHIGNKTSSTEIRYYSVLDDVHIGNKTSSKFSTMCTLVIKQVLPKYSDSYIFNWHSKFANCLTWPKVDISPYTKKQNGNFSE